MAFPTVGKSEPSPKPDKALVGTLKLVGMYKHMDPEDGLTYQVVVVTLKDGKVVEVLSKEPVYSDTAAINAATTWVDDEFYES